MAESADSEDVESEEPGAAPEAEAGQEAAEDSEFRNDVTQIYLNAIGANPLLTADQEREPEPERRRDAVQRSLPARPARSTGRRCTGRWPMRCAR